jgi:pimeloyl-ACP methyl ester carboxylesterase
MLHGLLIGSLATWYFTAAPVLARTHCVFLYDLRGHGRSQSIPSGYDLDSMVVDLEALMAHFEGAQCGPITLVGHSYGGLIALRFALRHPARVAQLALVEAPLPPSQLEDLGILTPRDVDLALERFLSQTPQEMAATLPQATRRMLGNPTQRRGRRLLKSFLYLMTQTSLVEDLRAEPDITDGELAQLACPLLCVYGKDSVCLPAGERLARLLPRARHARIAGGHVLPVEAREELNRELEGFLHH